MAYKALIEQVKKVSYLGSACSVLGWDQEVCMPKGGVEPRSLELATISEIAHSMFTSKIIGSLIKKAKSERLNSEQESNVRLIERDYLRSVRIPSWLVVDFAKVTTKAVEAWRVARHKSDFSVFSPHLAKVIALSKKKAQFIDDKKPAYDVLLDGHDFGLTSKKVYGYFGELKATLKSLVKKRAGPGMPVLSVSQQEVLCRFVAEKLGFDFTHGRIDRSTHPFSTGNSKDARITTRYSKDPFDSLLSTMHESGHAMYEQGLLWRNFGTPLGEPCSLSIHESQSRIWENHVGKSKEFIKWVVPKMQKLGCKVIAKDAYDWVNCVSPGFIRVDADEVTYHLHIILRFEIEKAIFDDKLRVGEIPSAWNEKMKSYLGIRPPNDAKGCLQDIHWSSEFAYFPTYTIGTMIAAQLFASAENSVEQLRRRISIGEFSALKNWLNKNIHQFGRRYDTDELVMKATGSRPDTSYLLKHLSAKYRNV
ncbi:carboxypeptidase M32 [Candidatus Woesearchaeota archaeon]|nr:carboxypeptidase M32 [Candidatus Woesearchaeota archaeon]